MVSTIDGEVAAYAEIWRCVCGEDRRWGVVDAKILARSSVV